MTKYYTNVFRSGNNIFVRGVRDGVHYKDIIKYKPYLFIETPKVTKYKTIDGKYADKMDFESPTDARNFLKQYSEVMGIHGMTDFAYTYIRDEHRQEINYNVNHINVGNIDIETEIKEGFPDVNNPENAITAISLSKNGQTVVFGCGEYIEHEENIKYYRFENEQAMLKGFLTIWNEFELDVITGWNINMFDIPYTVARIEKILGSGSANDLSPWKKLTVREVDIMGRLQKMYSIQGIAILDYLELYKSFVKSPRESYKLDYIAYVELGERKLDYSEYTDLQDMYLRDYQKYVEYNIKDVHLIERLEKKLKLIELVFAMAYDSKVNYEDTLGKVKQWDIIIHNYLLDRNIVIPQSYKSSANRSLPGGYVKEPKVGLSKWVVSLDVNSLYPHLIMQYNIGPDTFVEKIQKIVSIDDLINGAGEQFSSYIKDNNLAMAANLCLYRKDKKGFLADLMSMEYDGRSKFKAQMIECKKKYETEKSEDLLNEISRLDNLQKAKKEKLNSAYGAIGNDGFRWFNIDHAEAITLGGQLSIRWVAKDLNDYVNKILKTSDKDYVVAIDTDSVYLDLSGLVKAILPNETDETKIVDFLDQVCKSKLEPLIDNSYQNLADYMNAYEQKMVMKRENIASKGIWVAKKKYILNVWDSEGVRYKEPELKMMGIEAIRSSTPESCRDSIKQALKIIMNKDELTLQSYVRDFKDKFKQMSFEEVAFPRGTKDIEKWQTQADKIFDTGTPQHIKCAIMYNRILEEKGLEKKYNKIHSGDKIKFAYVKTPNYYQIEGIASPGGLPPEFLLDDLIDKDMQFEKAFLNPITSITNTIGWSPIKVSTLLNYFSDEVDFDELVAPPSETPRQKSDRIVREKTEKVFKPKKSKSSSLDSWI